MSNITIQGHNRLQTIRNGSEHPGCKEGFLERTKSGPREKFDDVNDIDIDSIHETDEVHDNGKISDHKIQHKIHTDIERYLTVVSRSPNQMELLFKSELIPINQHMAPPLV